MNSFVRWLQGNFIVCDLGSSGKEFHDLLEPFSEGITLIELDAAEEPAIVKNKYFKRVVFKNAISGTEGRRKFYQRKFLPCSSFLQPNEQVVQSYGLEKYFELDRAFDIDCITLDALVSKAEIRRIDFLKTDLEGLDFEILNSAPRLISSCLAIKCELRTHPLYRGEPSFIKSIGLLESAGFEVISIKPEIWKYNTKDRELFRDGRLVWGDFILFLTPSKVKEYFGKEAGGAICKQIIIARMLNLHNYAAYLLERHSDIISDEHQDYLRSLVYPSTGFRKILLTSIKAIGSTSLGNLFLRKTRNLLLQVQTVLQYDKNIKHLGSL